MQSRVFVTQQPKPNGKGWTPNLSPASNYGTIHFIYSGGDRPSSDPTAAMFIASEALEDFDANKDYILWPNGVDPFSIWAVLLVLAKKGVSQVRGLNWERRLHNGKRDPHNGFYTPVVFQLSQFNDSSYERESFDQTVDVSPLTAKHSRSNGNGNKKGK
jgi:hypothetical protein